MEKLIMMYLFILGLVFGSFFNVVGLRVPKKESIVFPKSHCTKCNHELAWYELIPVLSYLFLRGKCKNCQTRISPIYPGTELLTGILFAYAFYRIGWSIELIIALLLISLLVIIIVSDISYMLIPNKILLFFLAPFILLRIIYPLTPWWESIAGAAVGFLIPFLLAVISRGGMGGGDIKLFFVLGIILGTKGILLTLFFASIAGVLYGFFQMLAGKYKKKKPVPFGPFISIGALLAYFFGKEILNWYVNLLLI